MDNNTLKEFADKLTLKATKQEATAKLKNINKRIEESFVEAAIPIAESPKVTVPKKSKVEPKTLTIGGNGEGDSFKPDRDKLNTSSASWKFKNIGGFYMPQTDIKKLSMPEQERCLIRDLIYSFTGVPSTYIKTDKAIESYEEIAGMEISEMRFKINEDINSSIRGLAQELLPMVSHYLIMQNFIEESVIMTNCSQVRQALCSALNDYMGKYYEMQANLETELDEGKLNMQKFIFYLRPTLSCMDVFARIVKDVLEHQFNSAEIIDYLERQLHHLAAKEDVVKCMEKVLTTTVAPYFRMVQTWTQKAVIFDPHKDFFIEDTDNKIHHSLTDKRYRTSEYWAKRYRLHPERIPTMLANLEKEIFNAGMYLNLLHQSGVNLTCLNKPLEYNVEEPTYIEIIKEAYDYASKKVLDLLLKDNDLLGHLHSIKRYMLVEAGDFIAAFLDECDEELDKNVEFVASARIKRSLEDALHISSAKRDPHKDHVRFELFTKNLVDQVVIDLKEKAKAAEADEDPISSETEGLQYAVFELIAMKYCVKWPLSHVINETIMGKLQMLFRTLFYLKHLQHHLTKLWSLPRSSCVQTTKSCLLRQRMVNTIVNIEYYMTVDVIEPNWQAFLKITDKAANIDEIISAYNGFLNKCLESVLLTESATLINSIFTLGSICLNFCAFIENTNSEPDYTSFDNSIAEFEGEFNDMLQGILELIRDMAQINHKASCCHLLKRLDFVNTCVVHNSPKTD